VTEWWRTVRATARRLGTVPLLLRLVVLASCTVAVTSTIVPAWDVPNGYVVIAALAAVVASIVPDSGGGLCFAAAIVTGWATGAESAAVGPALVVTALALLVGHVAGALAAAMPATAAADARLMTRWWRPTAAIGAGVVATAILVGALDAWSPPGSIIVVLAALVVAGLGVWWWSAIDEA